MLRALRRHWPEYLIEAAGLGVFMISANLFGALLEHPASPVRAAVENAAARRLLMGCAMGLTAIALIYSPWGQRSGAHFNPSTTLAFFRLGKIRGRDALLYPVAQVAGGLAGSLLAAALLPAWVAHPAVNHVATVPGAWGPGPAFAAEIAISFVLMLVVLHVANTPRVARFTGLAAGLLVATYIAIEAPVSGMSMNPARSLASAVPARAWSAFWIYVVAPPIGMLLAAQAFLALRGARAVACAKLHHGTGTRCIFLCGRGATRAADETSARAA
jgi:aquaporin Z